MPIFTVPGATLYVTEAGAGPPRVFVHGTGGNADVWQAVLPRFAATHRTIAYDRRGYQRSSGPSPSVHSFHRQHGEDLAALLQTLGASPATVVGWSAGGFAALRHPECINHLVLYEPHWHAKKHVTWPLFKPFLLIGMARLTARPRSGAAAFLRMATANADGSYSLAEIPAELRASMAKDVGALLPLFTAALARIIAVFPRARVVTIAGGHHFAQIHHPDAFSRALEEALLSRVAG